MLLLSWCQPREKEIRYCMRFQMRGDKGEEDENWCRRRIYFFSAGTFWCGISAAASKAVANEGETAPCRAVPCRNAIIIKIGTTQDSRHAVLLCCSLLHMGYTCWRSLFSSRFQCSWARSFSSLFLNLISIRFLSAVVVAATPRHLNVVVTYNIDFFARSKSAGQRTLGRCTGRYQTECCTSLFWPFLLFCFQIVITRCVVEE